ncbi:MAG TPA: hypothetical protein VGO57_08165 [Verrucomicrobiae bacterium]
MVDYIDKFAAPVFGIKAKPSIPTAKPAMEFAAPVFGIKAKPWETAAVAGEKFAAPVFGIKAKRSSNGTRNK